MADAMPVRSRKQSESAAATLYSPPETWISKERALRNGTTPGSRRCTMAPRARKSNVHRSWRRFRPVMKALHRFDANYHALFDSLLRRVNRCHRTRWVKRTSLCVKSERESPNRRREESEAIPGNVQSKPERKNE